VRERRDEAALGRHRRRPGGRWVLLAVLGPFVVVAACGSSGDSASTSARSPGSTGTPSSPTSSPASSPALEGTTWEVAPGGLDVDGLDHITPTLRLEAGRAGGFAGCNTFNGSYTLHAPSLSFGPLAQTSMACEPVGTAIERAYLAALAKVATYALSSSTLELKDASGTTVLTFGTGNTSLLGSWTATGYLTSTGSAFNSVENGSTLTADFAADGTVNGNSGCNSYRGPWSLAADGGLSIGPLASTKIACKSDALSAQEASFLTAMEASIGAVIGSHQAVFNNQAGQTTVELTR
jgi:putative lipoprotein